MVMEGTMEDSTRQQEPASLASLPREILHAIFLGLDRADLLHLRLQSAYVGEVATALAFRSLRLVAYGSSPLDLVRIARSPRLRGLVQELTCDTAIHPDIVDFRAYGYREPVELLKALAVLPCFRGLRALHLRFMRDYWHVYDGEFETTDFRLRVLHTVFACLAGGAADGASWPIDWAACYEDEMEHQYHTSSGDDDGDSQGGIDRDLSLAEESEESLEQESDCREDDFFDLRHIPSHLLPDDMETGPIHLTTFTIANLAAQRDARLLEDDVFSRVLSSPSLTSLKLLITPALAGIGASTGRRADMRISMYSHMPSTWLMPSAVAHLKELSLYSHEYWGWFPKLDLRDLGPMPNLKVLALGQYTFSHQWQVDWLTSLGLEELYLDRCAVLHQVRTWEGWVDGSAAYTTDGQQASHEPVPNEGYLNPDWRFMDHRGELTLYYPLRWHAMFRQWRDSMASLRVLRVGVGAWRGAPQLSHSLEAFYAEPARRLPRAHTSGHDAFRDYACPPVSGRQGDRTGICEDHESALLYLYFEGKRFKWWDRWQSREQFSTSGFPSFTEQALEDGWRERDRLAQRLLVSAIESRAK